MIDKLITLDTAKLAKEKGFKEECYAYYGPDSVHCYAYSANELHIGNRLSVFGKRVYNAPTQTHLRKWLSTGGVDDMGVDIMVKPYFSEQPKHYQTFLWYRGEEYVLELYYPSYEDALEAGLFKALELNRYFE